MNNKNSSKDFALKKEFIDLQIELRKFIDETELFTLNDILKDPLVVHSLDDYINAYEELADIKKINKTLKRLAKLRKNNVDINEALSKIEKTPRNTIIENECDEKEPVKINLSNTFTFSNTFFNLRPVKTEKELDREKMLQKFKAHFKKIDALRKIQIPKLTVNRNLTVSSSHSHLFKKIEKGNNEQPSNTMPKSSTEITTNASFRNGIIRSVEKTQRPNLNTIPSSNVIKATRSPHQSTSSPNQHNLNQNTNQSPNQNMNQNFNQSPNTSPSETNISRDESQNDEKYQSNIQ